MTSSQRLKLYNWLSGFIPDVGRLMFIRAAFLRWCGVEVGRGCFIAPTVRFCGCGKIRIGDNVCIRHGSVFAVGNGGCIEIGNHVLIAEYALLESHAEDRPGCVKIGNHVDVMMYSIVSANGAAVVSIGDNCRIAHNVSIKATHHHINPAAECIGDVLEYDDISIGEGCWICAGAIIIPGVHVGKKNVIAAGAVVTKDTPDYALMAGVPAGVKRAYPINS